MWLQRHIESTGSRGEARGIVVATLAVMRAVMLCLLLGGCWTNSQGRVNLTASAGIWGGALIVGGAVVGAGQCDPSPENCDRVERGDPVVAATLLVAGASLVALAALLDRAEN